MRTAHKTCISKVVFYRHQNFAYLLLLEMKIQIHRYFVILGFKHLEDDDKENVPCGEDLIARMNYFHERLMSHVSLNALQEPVGEVSIRQK